MISLSSSRLFIGVTTSCAVFFAMLVLLPHILQHADMLYPFQGIEIMATDAEIHYAARVREIVDGFWQTGNTYYSLPKDQPFLQPPLPEIAAALPAILFDSDPVIGFVVFAVISGLLLFLIMTGAMVALTGRRWESLLAVSALVFAGAMLGAPWDFLQYVYGNGGFEMLRFSRPINPLWTGIWFFGAVWWIAAWVRTRDIRCLVGFSVFFIVLVYSYLYAWSYLLVAAGLITMWFVARREWKSVIHLSACGAVVGIVSLPYVFHILVTMHHPLYADSAIRIGLVRSHAPFLGVWMLIGLMCILLMYRRLQGTWPLAASLIFAGILVMNQHVITGSFVAPHHYHWYFFHPLTSLVTMVAILWYVRGWISSAWIQTSLFIVLLLGAMTFGVRQQTLAYATARAEWGEKQVLAPVITYIASHASTGTVVYSNDVRIEDLVPIYTSADVYYATNANNYLVPLARVRDAYFFRLWLQGFTQEDARLTFPTTRRAELSSNLYAIHYRELLGAYDAIPDAVVQQNIDAYALYVGQSLDQKLARYPFNLFVTTPSDAQTLAYSQVLARGTEVFSQSGYTVLSMR